MKSVKIIGHQVIIVCLDDICFIVLFDLCRLQIVIKRLFDMVGLTIGIFLHLYINMYSSL